MRKREGVVDKEDGRENKEVLESGQTRDRSRRYRSRVIVGRGVQEVVRKEEEVAERATVRRRERGQ